MSKSLALSIRIETNSDYGRYAHMVAVPVLVNDESHGDGAHFSSSGEIDYGSSHIISERWHDGFQVRAQANLDDKRDFYGWEVVYRDKYTISIRDCESMLSIMKKVDKSLEKQTSADGSPTCFAEYVYRVAKALGCRFIVFRNSPERMEQSGYGYKAFPMGGSAIDRLRAMESDFVNAEHEYASAH